MIFVFVTADKGTYAERTLRCAMRKYPYLLYKQKMKKCM